MGKLRHSGGGALICPSHSQKPVVEEKKGLPFPFLAKHRNPLERKAGLCGGLPDPLYHIFSSDLGVSPTARSCITAERIPSTAPGLAAPGARGNLRAWCGGDKRELIEMQSPKELRTCSGTGRTKLWSHQALLHPLLLQPHSGAEARGDGARLPAGAGQQQGGRQREAERKKPSPTSRRAVPGAEHRPGFPSLSIPMETSAPPPRLAPVPDCRSPMATLV